MKDGGGKPGGEGRKRKGEGAGERKAAATLRLV